MRVNHVNIVVADMARSVAFYTERLGMRVTFEAELQGDWIETVTGLPGVRARCVFCQPADGGGTRFELLQYLSPADNTGTAAALPNAPGLRHVAFEVDDLDAWHERLRTAGVPFVSAPVTVPFGVAGARKRLCYFRDPDGVLLELSAYTYDAAPGSGVPAAAGARPPGT